MLTQEIIAVRRTLFADYCNVRDKIKRTLSVDVLALNPAQAQKIFSTARKNYRRREMTRTTKWFGCFREEVRKKYNSVPVHAWQSVKDLY